ncbi:hypothetical protein TURU_034387 [Turdus rufiventris]|nr:hypothetical protein TURU_034387 [Turdus rufiventris]
MISTTEGCVYDLDFIFAVDWEYALQSYHSVSMWYLEDREVIQDSQHSFTKGKSCLTNLVTFYDGVTASLDKGRLTDVIYLDFYKAFDTVLTSFSPNWREMGLMSAVICIRNCSDGRIKRVEVNGSESQRTSVTSGAHQGSALRPVLFGIFINDTDKGIERTPSKTGNDSKLSGAVDTPEGWDVILRDLDKLKWAHSNLRQFNKTKCQVLHLDWGNPQYQHRLENNRAEDKIADDLYRPDQTP